MNWIKYSYIYAIVSLTVIGIGIYSYLSWGLPVGVDFTGGTVVEYKASEISTERIFEKFTENKIPVALVRTTDLGSFIIQFEDLAGDNRTRAIEILKELTGSEVTELRFEHVGPTFGAELIKKTVAAIAIASLVILFWIAYQFQSLRYGFAAVFAMFHDSIVLLGLFALLGHIGGAQLDFLFVTALLTTLSFSVHDTIVVFDRIREIRKKHGGDIATIANQAISISMRRSINNSLTIIIVLLSLVLFGGSSVRWFATALLIGTISGTYSSPFVSVPLLVFFHKKLKK